MTAAPGTIDAYLAPLSAGKRAALEKLRRAIKAAAPDAEECISYRIPAFRLGGKVLVWFGAATEHCAFYPGAYPIEALKADLAGYDTGKGTIRYPVDRPLPAPLVRKLVEARIAEQAKRRPRGHRSGRSPVKAAPSQPPSPADAERRLKGFIAKFDPKHQTLIRAVRRALRSRFRTAYELAYDNYNFFVLGYGPTGRPSDCIVSIAAGASGVGLCLIHGAKLPDPHKLLLGSGTQTRFIRLASAAVLDRPAVKALLAAAIARSKTPLPARGHVTLIIRSVSAKQRPRRRPAT